LDLIYYLIAEGESSSFILILLSELLVELTHQS